MKLLLAGLAAATLCAAQVPSCDLVAGWTQQGAARSYDAASLYEYMDGNSEGYLLYGFQAMHGVTCVRGGDSILIDVSEFPDGDSAYGMFSANRDPRLPGEKLGTGGQATPRRVIFVKDRYYAELAADKEHGPELLAFAAALEKKLPGSTAVPETLAWFPPEGQKSARLIAESVLGIRLLARGYVAEYDFGKAFVVAEPSSEAAIAVMDKLRARFGATGDPLVLNDRYLGRLCFLHKGRYIVGYANVAEGHDPLSLANALAARVP
ncbi:MAG TPA: DUF6599 family protein [Bryobacteraceae bacterium]|nr:DUF6599 family protein [Bryobacteraceae bacterium]